MKAMPLQVSKEAREGGRQKYEVPEAPSEVLPKTRLKAVCHGKHAYSSVHCTANCTANKLVMN